jgi:hypothetical protein
MAQSAPAAEPPPGMPIGEDDDCWLCGSLAAQ